MPADFFPNTHNELVNGNSISEVNGDIETVNQNGVSHSMSTKINTSPSIKQKVKFIPQNHFVHIKPPPVNTQKIYKTHNAGSQSYTLGVNNISSTDIPLSHSKLIAVTNNNSINETRPTSKNVTIIKTPTKTSATADHDNMYATEPIESASSDLNATASLNDINILEIPILFADNDGNLLNDNPDAAESIETTDESIDILSAPEDDNSVASQNDDNVQISLESSLSSADTSFEDVSSQEKQISGLNGRKFVVLKRSNQLRPVKLKKMIIQTKKSPAVNGTSANEPIILNKEQLIGDKTSTFKLLRPITRQFQTNKSSRIQKVYSLPSTKSNQSFKLLNGRTLSNQQQSTKNGILFKRTNLNGLGNTFNQNITIRKVNIVRDLSNGKKPLKHSNIEYNEQNSNEKPNTDDASIEEIKRTSAQDLIDELES